MLRSETTKGMSDTAVRELENKISKLNSDDLKDFVRSFDPDAMGFYGQEGINELKDQSEPDNC